jgi:hypothetical protein
MRFLGRLALIFAIALGGATIVSPFVGALVSSSGWRVPFPRIFDRVAMVSIFGAVLFAARDLNAVALIRAGFANPARNFTRWAAGLALSVAIVTLLGAIACIAGGTSAHDVAGALARAPKYFAAAVVISIIEEAFFRAFILGGLRATLGRNSAIALSALIYAAAHLVRSPAKFYVVGYAPLAGIATLGHSFDQFGDPATASAVLFGMFILGWALGEAFVETGTVYLSMGIHAGVVLGAKLWPKLIGNRASVPHWIAGVGAVPMIGGPAAWIAIGAVIAVVRRFARAEKAFAAPRRG